MAASHPQHHRLTLADYFFHERMSLAKHEFAHGQIYVMAGCSPRHNHLSLQVLRFLPSGVGSACVTLSSGQRIATPDGLYTYADGSVFCGPMSLGPMDTALNPAVLVEVLSDATRDYDRGAKLEHYKSIESLQHVLLVEQNIRAAEVWSRTQSGWEQVLFEGSGARIRLPEIRVEIPLSELYVNVERFPL